MRTKTTTHTEDLAQRARRLEVRTRRSVGELFAGEYRSAFRGRGMEFDEVRAYAPGDEVRTIDWNVTARTGQPYVKRFVEERELTAFVVLDTGVSMRTGTRRKTKIGLATELCSLLALAAADANDRVGMLRFGAGPLGVTPIGKGRRHAMRAVHEAANAPAVDNRTNSTPLEALRRLETSLQRRAVVVIASDFRSFCSESWKRLGAASQRHDLVALRTVDPSETNLPKAGIITLSDPITGATATINTNTARARRRYTEAAHKQAAAHKKRFASIGADHADIRTNDDAVHALLHLFRAREHKR